MHIKTVTITKSDTMALIKTLLVVSGISIVLGCNGTKVKDETAKVTLESTLSVPYFKSKTILLLKSRSIIADTYSSSPPQKETDTLVVPHLNRVIAGQPISEPIYFLTIPIGKQYSIKVADQYWLNFGTMNSFSLKEVRRTRLMRIRLYPGVLFFRAHEDSLYLQTDHFGVKAGAGSTKGAILYSEEVENLKGGA